MRLLLYADKLMRPNLLTEFVVVTSLFVHLPHCRNKKAACAGTSIYYGILNANDGDLNEELSQVSGSENNSETLLIATCIPKELSVELADYIDVVVLVKKRSYVTIDIAN